MVWPDALYERRQCDYIRSETESLRKFSKRLAFAALLFQLATQILVCQCLSTEERGELARKFKYYHRSVQPTERFNLVETVNGTYFALNAELEVLLTQTTVSKATGGWRLHADLALFVHYNDDRLVLRELHDVLQIPEEFEPWIPDIEMGDASNAFGVVNVPPSSDTTSPTFSMQRSKHLDPKTGQLTVLHRVAAEVGCTMDAWKFPFERVTCGITFQTEQNEHLFLRIARDLRPSTQRVHIRCTVYEWPTLTAQFGFARQWLFAAIVDVYLPSTLIFSLAVFAQWKRRKVQIVVGMAAVVCLLIVKNAQYRLVGASVITTTVTMLDVWLSGLLLHLVCIVTVDLVLPSRRVVLRNNVTTNRPPISSLSTPLCRSRSTNAPLRTTAQSEFFAALQQPSARKKRAAAPYHHQTLALSSRAAANLSRPLRRQGTPPFASSVGAICWPAIKAKEAKHVNFRMLPSSSNGRLTGGGWRQPTDASDASLLLRSVDCVESYTTVVERRDGSSTRVPQKSPEWAAGQILASPTPNQMAKFLRTLDNEVAEVDELKNETYADSRTLADMRHDAALSGYGNGAYVNSSMATSGTPETRRHNVNAVTAKTNAQVLADAIAHQRSQAVAETTLPPRQSHWVTSSVTEGDGEESLQPWLTKSSERRSVTNRDGIMLEEAEGNDLEEDEEDDDYEENEGLLRAVAFRLGHHDADATPEWSSQRTRPRDHHSHVRITVGRRKRRLLSAILSCFVAFVVGYFGIALYVVLA